MFYKVRYILGTSIVQVPTVPVDEWLQLKFPRTSAAAEAFPHNERAPPFGAVATSYLHKVSAKGFLTKLWRVVSPVRSLSLFLAICEPWNNRHALKAPNGL